MFGLNDDMQELRAENETLKKKVVDLESDLQKTRVTATTYRSGLQDISDGETGGLDAPTYAYAILNPE